MAPSAAARRLAVLARAVAPAPAPPRPVGPRGVSAAPEQSTAEYRAERVLFTGGAGFIGSNVLIHMVRTYPDVFFLCLDNLSEGSNQANLEPVQEARNLVVATGDITCEATVRSLMSEHCIDTVMHFAAQTHVDRSFARPVQFSEANVIGTAVLLKVSHELGVKRFLHVSTDEVYGENVDGVFDESAHLMPGNPYSASKAGAECLVRGYLSSYDMPIVVVRPNNIYGPRQFPEKMIPKFILRLLRDQSLPLHGGGYSRRSFLFVQDAAEAFDLVLRRGVPGEAYNIGAPSDSTRSVKDVALSLLPYFGVDSSKLGEHLDVVEDRFKNDASYDVDSAKIRALGWSPKVNFEEGLRRTVEWYVAHQGHWGAVEEALKAHNAGGALSAAVADAVAAGVGPSTGARLAAIGVAGGDAASSGARRVAPGGAGVADGPGDN